MQPTETPPPSPSLRPYALGAAGASTLIGTLVMIGWYANVPALIRIRPTWAAMHVNTAQGFVLSGVALAALVLGAHRLRLFAGALVGMLGAVKLVEHVAGTDTLLSTSSGHVGAAVAPSTAICFVLISLAVLLPLLAVRWARAASGILGATLCGLSCVFLSGYVFGLSTTYGWDSLAGDMAWHTALAMALLGGGLFVAARESDTNYRSWTPVATATAVAATAIMLWQALSAVQDQHAQTAARLQSRTWIAQARGAVNERLHELQRMQSRWTRRVADEARWRADASEYVAHSSMYVAIQWIHRDGNVRWTVSRANTPTADSPIAPPPNASAVAIGPPLDLPRLGKAFRIYLPLERPGQPTQFLAATISFSSLSHDLSTLPQIGRAIRLTSDGQVVLRRGALSASAATSITRFEVAGRSWQLTLVASEEITKGSLAPWVVLLVGLLAAWLAHVSLKRGALARQKTAALETSNHELADKSSALAQANAEGLRKQRQLEVANTELDGFTYSVSHDLRAPLRAVDGFARILVEDHARTLDNDGQRVVTVIRKNVDKMSQLIDDLLAFSRLGRQELTPVQVDMTALATKQLAELTQVDQAHAAAVNANIDTLPEAIGDLALLRQVWANLLGNALKYSRDATPARIKVRGEATDGEVIYTIVDNGVGFDMTYADKLFGVFQRLHKASEFEGTGVGLAIVQRIVARHGGRVWAQSNPGEGAEFHFALPIKES